MCFHIETARFGRKVEIKSDPEMDKDNTDIAILIAGLGRGAVAKIGDTRPAFVFCLHGDLQLQSNGQSLLISEGQLYVNTESDIRISSIGDAQWLTLYFSGNDYPHLIGEPNGQSTPLFTSVETFNDGTRKVCLDILLHAHSEKCPVEHAEALIEILANYHSLCSSRLWKSPGRNEKAQRLSLQRLLKARNKIATDPGSSITIAQLAAQANYSEWHFIRLFHRVFEETPIEYANRLRLKRAKHMLISSRMTVSEIARDSGYETFSAFCRSFRHHYGMTASSLRVKTAAP